MAWKSSGKKQESKWKNYSGIANVVLSKDKNGVTDGKSVTFVFVDDEKNKKREIVGLKFTFKVVDLKGNFKTMQYSEKSAVFVNINENTEDGTQELSGVRPVRGTFFLKFHGFTHRGDGKEVILKEDDEIWEGKNSGKKIQCFANYEIVDGRYTGALVPTSLMIMRYSKEVIVENNNEVDLAQSGKGGWTKAAMAWLNLFEVNNVEGGIKWPESNDIQDVLKNIEETLKESNCIFTSTLDNAYPGVLAIPDIDELEQLYVKHPELKPSQPDEVEEEDEEIEISKPNDEDDDEEDLRS